MDITPAGVSKLLKNLHSHKATGPEGIPTHLLKVTADEVAGTLRLIFHTSLTQGTVISNWKKAHIVPVCKKRDRANPAKYRQSPLLQYVAKL